MAVAVASARRPAASAKLFFRETRGFLELLPLAGAEASDLAEVMKRYQDIGPQLANAALVYLADREGIDTIFTLDRRDFGVYRSAQKRAFRIVP